ncbi:hypothetical protein [Actinoplanes sp. NBRC 101535]|nr:hypothetical protein [Actinoplanes sp. NBRC 101535]
MLKIVGALLSVPVLVLATTAVVNVVAARSEAADIETTAFLNRIPS